MEKDEVVMTIGSARPLEDATRNAYRELARWMVISLGFVGKLIVCVRTWNGPSLMLSIIVGNQAHGEVAPLLSSRDRVAEVFSDMLG